MACRMKPVVAALALLLGAGGSLPVDSAAPVSVFASPNVQLESSAPDAGAIGGRFGRIGGRMYFFQTGVSGLRVYDASNPTLPLLVGALALPHEENEDVDLSVSRGILLVSQDRTGTGQGALYVIGISTPSLPRIAGTLLYPRTPLGGAGGGHIANCILDCRYAWITGAGDGYVLTVDLTKPAAPRAAAWFQPPAGHPNDAFTRGSVHDVNVDPVDGTVWVTGSGGISAYRVTTDAQAVDPGVPLASFDAGSTGREDLNTFIHHNSLRPDPAKPGLLLVTEEDWLHPTNSCTATNQGRFQTYSFVGSSIEPLAQWKTEYLGGTYANGRSPVQVTCSAHWFDYRPDGLVAIAWYNQGVRFLDVSSPSAMRQVGYWLPPGSTAFAAYFHPERTDLVYVVDGTRGLDVLRFVGSTSGAGTVAPAAFALSSLAGALETPTVRSPVRFEASPVWGYACLVPARALPPA